MDNILMLRVSGLTFDAIGKRLGISRQAVHERYKKSGGELRLKLPLGMKRCSMCGRVLSISQFHKTRTRYDGKSPYCKDCNVVKQREYYKNHPDNVRRVVRDYARRYPEKIKAHGVANYLYPIRQKCSVDGCFGMGERHHPNYNEPDKIEWFCRHHHRMLTNELSMV